MNFFATHSTAEAWASAHPEITGGILSQARALEVAEQIFGQLLRLSQSGLARTKGLGALANSSGFPEDKISQLRNCALFTCIRPSRTVRRLA